MKKEKIYRNPKIIFTIFFLTLSTIMFSLYNLVSSYNKNVGENKFINFFISQGEKFFQIEKYNFLDENSFYNKELLELTEDDMDKINMIVNLKGYTVYRIKKNNYVYKDIYELLNIRHEYGIIYDAYSYQSDNVDIISINDMNLLFNEKIIGKMPTNSNEILISNYIADLIINYGIKKYNNGVISIDYYKFDNYESLIDENTYFVFNNNKVKISGIIDYDLSEYELLKNKNWDELNDNELKFGDELIRKAKNIYSKIYVNQSFIDTLTNSAKIVDSCIVTGIIYQANFDGGFSSIIHKFKNNGDFLIKTTYSDDYYNTLYLTLKLKNVFFYSSILCLIVTIILLLISRKEFKLHSDNKIIYDIKIDFLVVLISMALSSVFYSFVILLFRNIICSAFFQPLTPFEFSISQYVIILVLPILIVFLSRLCSCFNMLNKKLKK